MKLLSPVFEALLAALDRMEIPFFVGGSVASSLHGIALSTADIDIVADFSTTDVEEFCGLLSAEFYVDSAFVTDAIASGRSFNVIHLKAAVKVDFFPVAREGFTRSELGRRRYLVSGIPGLEHLEIPTASPEDTILAKLSWFRKGGGVSDRQWHDIIGVLKMQAGGLDTAYMREWAAKLHVSDLLDEAIREAQ